LKMDGINGRFVQWRYMTLEIKKLPKKWFQNNESY
jgi:hypothetical protein